MLNISQYKLLTNLLFMSLFLIKFSNVIQDRIEIILFIFWIVPLLIFYFFINKLMIRSYQWFCFFLIIYFLFSSLRVFVTNPYWIDILELVSICTLFIHIMFGPRVIKSIN
ncbi:MAG: hypothetical protein CBD86_00145 [Gammaproteobacteria bacterium TMED226]|nr:MAG: hypothetical protein CBD86_00145 [Gammaproteobacteria bacterium TMED226]